MSDINVNIMAHPKRAEYIPYLLERLGDVPVIWDESNNVWDTRRRCLLEHASAGKKYALTIQDDCLLTDDFLNKAEQFIRKHEKKHTLRAYNFYFGSRSSQQILRAKGKGYFRRKGMKSGLAICLPTQVISDLLEMWEGTSELERHDDSRIGIYLKRRHFWTFYPCPSLVQHRDSESLIYKSAPPRKSICYEQ